MPVGLGTLDDAGFGQVGGPTDAKTRAELVDETLAILVRLCSSQPFAYDGKHYGFGPMTFRPTPIQQPRIPIWVVGVWPSERSMRRVVRWDGIVTQTRDVNEIRAIADYATRARQAELQDWSFDIVVQGSTRADDPAAAAATVEPYAEAGATWWIDADWEHATVTSVRARIAAGPPRRLRSRPRLASPRNRARRATSARR